MKRPRHTVGICTMMGEKDELDVDARPKMAYKKLLPHNLFDHLLLALSIAPGAFTLRASWKNDWVTRAFGAGSSLFEIGPISAIWGTARDPTTASSRYPGAWITGVLSVGAVMILGDRVSPSH